MRTVLIVLAVLPAAAADLSSPDFFEMKVRPVLAKNCFACHSQSKLGGLEATSREGLLKGGKSGPAIVPGKPDKSLLMKAVNFADEKLKMPMQGGKLKDDEIAALARWIRDGAVWPETAKAAAVQKSYNITPEQKSFWSFQPIRKAAAPKTKGVWAKTEIDRFILAKLDQKGWKPAPSADRRTLIRRATYDLTGLPPMPEDVDAFIADKSPSAFAKVVDRLLESPHYGERWGRYWLDVARYSDDRLNSTMEEPAPNAYRYRDWVIDAFNKDMPFDTFAKAQIAGDLMGDKALAAGVGMYGLSPEFQDDRVDVTTRGFLGLTVACAQCHDHKYDPIPQKDYYALQGVFDSVDKSELPLADDAVVAEYRKRKKAADDADEALKEFVKSQAEQLADMLSFKAARYLIADKADGLDQELFDKWKAYLKRPVKEHPFLKGVDSLTGDALAKFAEEFQAKLIDVSRERKQIEEKNFITLGGSKKRGDLSQANLLSLERDKYFLWRDFFGTTGVLYSGDKKIDRHLQGSWKDHADYLRAEASRLKKEVPEQYPFLHIVKDKEKPHNAKLLIKGNRNNPGDEVPRAFVTILSGGEPKPFVKGAGRLELAEAIADPKNPLTPRVIANRLWLGHFGTGLVRTPANFGFLGERPSNPELLEYLAARLIENKWSIKSMHREIMLSATYQESAESRNEMDPDNRLLGAGARRRLDAESLRDSVLAVSGMLDPRVGGKAERMDEKNVRRTIYGYISRKKLDPMLALFDFPNPNNTSEQRLATDVPTQRLFLLNSAIMLKAAEKLNERIGEGDAAVKIQKAYRYLFTRPPSQAEVKVGLDYVATASKDAWPQYLQVLMSSNEFLYVN